MEILFLGTGAFDYQPGLEGQYRDKFDCDCRRSSSVLVDGRLMIDCGDYALNSLAIAGVKKKEIADLLITHTHRDHCRPDLIEKLAAAVPGGLNVWCHESAAAFFPKSAHYAVHSLRCGEPEQIGGFSVSALYANHRTERTEERPVHYVLEKGGKKIFYGCDGAWFLTPTFYALMHAGFSLFVFDGTVGDYDGDFRICEHNSIPMVRKLIVSMKPLGVFADNCKIYISHLAPSLHAPHRETSRKLAAEGILVARDGLVETV